jgi:hypothetical protein
MTEQSVYVVAVGLFWAVFAFILYGEKNEDD